MRKRQRRLADPIAFVNVRWNVWLWLGVLLIAVTGCESQDVDSSPGKQLAAGSVTLEIDFHGRQENKKIQVPYSPNSTVLSILQQARDQGDIEFVVAGAGETAFVRSIDGIENEQAAGDNWTYQVNRELAARSCGVFPLNTGDQILWRFGKYP